VNRLIAVMLTLAAAASTVAAASRIAVVDVKSVYNQLPSTAALMASEPAAPETSEPAAA
jgi:Skp family chaperone for outer membrane proteins